MNNFGKVAVMFGGTSAEREVSLNSGQAVLNALVGAGVDAHAFDPSERALSQLVSENFSRVFIVLHGRGGEDGTMQGALELLGIPYTGSGVLGAALAMDKIKTKQIWQAMGLPTAKYHVVKAQHSAKLDYANMLAELNGMAMVKPSHEGSSIGMAKVTNAAQLEQAITNAFEFDSEVLIEQWITGSEYTVAVLDQQALPAISMTTPNDFYDYEAKYQTNTTQYHCPCGLDNVEEQKLGQLAFEAFNAVNAKGWGRVDFMRDEQGNWYLLEVNTVPGMTEKSLVPKAAAQAGISFEQLVLNILAQSKV